MEEPHDGWAACLANTESQPTVNSEVLPSICQAQELLSDQVNTDGVFLFGFPFPNSV